MTVEIPETFFWIVVGLGVVSLILSAVEIYYRRKLWKTQRGQTDEE